MKKLTIFGEAKDFIKKLLIVEPSERLTAELAMSHPWLAAPCTSTLDASFPVESPIYNTPVSPTPTPSSGFPSPTKDLLPSVLGRFNARKMFFKAVDVVKAINKLNGSPNGSHVQLNLNNATRSPAPSALPSMVHLADTAKSRGTSALNLAVSGMTLERTHKSKSESDE
jgi:serine/threonine protein kinase